MQLFANDSTNAFIFRDGKNDVINDSAIITINGHYFFIDMRDTFYLKCNQYTQPLSLIINPLYKTENYFLPVFKKISDCNTLSQMTVITFLPVNEIKSKKGRKKRSNPLW